MDSVLAQQGLNTQFKLQIIVIDDASSDDTRDVVARYPSVRYIRLDRQRGPAAARNIGLRASTGDYIAFLDDDDLWLPHKLRDQLPVLEDNREVAVVYGQAVMIREGFPDVQVPAASSGPSGSVFRDLLMGCFFVHPAVLLLRHEVFRTVGYFDEQLRSIEDFDLWLRIAFRFRFQFIPGPVSVYHSTPQGLYFTEVLHGSGAESGRTVVHRALEMLPTTRDNERLRREVLLRTQSYSVMGRVLFAPPEERGRAAMTVLESTPEILRYRWGREIAMEIVPLLAASEAPIATIWAWCKKIQTASGGLVPWFAMQLAASSIWTGTALQLAHGPVVNIPAARAAAALAVLHNPAKLRAKDLRRLLMGAGGRPADRRSPVGREPRSADLS